MRFGDFVSVSETDFGGRLKPNLVIVVVVEVVGVVGVVEVEVVVEVESRETSLMAMQVVMFW